MAGRAEPAPDRLRQTKLPRDRFGPAAFCARLQRLRIPVVPDRGLRFPPARPCAILGAESAEGRKEKMKMHKFFAWAAVICFLLAIITGYQRK